MFYIMNIISINEAAEILSSLRYGESDYKTSLSDTDDTLPSQDDDTLKNKIYSFLVRHFAQHHKQPYYLEMREKFHTSQRRLSRIMHQLKDEGLLIQLKPGIRMRVYTLSHKIR